MSGEGAKHDQRYTRKGSEARNQQRDARIVSRQVRPIYSDMPAAMNSLVLTTARVAPLSPHWRSSDSFSALSMWTI